MHNDVSGLNIHLSFPSYDYSYFSDNDETFSVDHFGPGGACREMRETCSGNEVQDIKLPRQVV
jgi:hypothetical protein